MRTSSKRQAASSGFLTITLFLFLLPGFSYSQSFLKGLGFEVGGGYNQLFWKAPSPVPESDYLSRNRTAFSLTPTLRLKYEVSLSSDLSVSPFVGYNRFGGESQRWSNGYQDEIWFDALNTGILVSYQVSRVSLGLGYEINRHIKATGRFLASADQPASSNRSWTEFDWTNMFARWSQDLGVRVTYQLSRFSFSLESWYGLTPLQGMNGFAPAAIRQNNERILLGYTF
jgi:hypothetical protein